MPRIVKSDGVRVADGVVKISDFAPRPAQRPAANGTPGAVSIPEFEPEYGTEGGFAEGNAPQVEMSGGVSQVQGEIIQGAMAEASRILEAAVKTAESNRADIMAQTHVEVDRMKKEALEQGRRQGFSSVIGEMRDVANGLEEAIARFEGERAGYEAEYEDHLKWFAIEIASKVLAKKVSRDDAELLEMVQKTVSNVQNEPWIRIEVAQEMSRLIERLNEIFGADENISVSTIPAKPGTIQIETPSGLIDASLQTQLGNLKEYFDKVKERMD